LTSIFYQYKDAWYNTQEFAKDEKVGLRWYLIRKTAVENSFAKTFDDQKRFLGTSDEVPQACELVYAIVLYFMVTGEQLFPRVGVRTSSIYPVGRRVYVGRFDSLGLDIYSRWDGDRSDDGVIASARKSKK
jgi:hypothetical protein